MNMPLKEITNLDAFSGLKVEILKPFNRNFQIAGTWKYNRMASTFGLNSALVYSMRGGEPSYVTGNQQSDGRLDCRGILSLGNNFTLTTEAAFHDEERKGIVFELTKSFDFSAVFLKFGTATRSFGYMQTLFRNCFAGFECSSMVFWYKHVAIQQYIFMELWSKLFRREAFSISLIQFSK